MKKIYGLFFIISIALVAGVIGINNVNAEGYGLYVNGEEFTTEKTIINCGNGIATFNESTNTLTLNNATITIGYDEGYERNNDKSGIYYNKNKLLTIIANNNNTIKSVKESFNDGIFSLGNITIINNGNLNITGVESGICAGNDGEKAIVLKGKNYQIETEIISIYGYLKLENIAEKIMAASNQYGINAFPITKTELLKKANKEDDAYEFLKIGNFKTYKIKKLVNQTGYNYLPSEAYEGEKIAVFEKDLKHYFEFKSVNITKKSNNANIINKVGYNSKNYTFTMPNYDINVKIKMKNKKKVTKKVNTLKAKLTSYNSVKLSGKDKLGLNEGPGGPGEGYYIYYKTGKNKKYKFLGKGKEVGINKYYKIYEAKDLKSGKKYTFKLVWFWNGGYYGDFDILSTKSKTVTIRTLKKAKTPKVVKEDKKHVTVKVNNIKGATGYKIATSKYKDKGFKTVATIKNNKNSKVLKVKKGKKVYYKVRAYKKEGNKKVYAPWSKVNSYKLK